MSLSSNFNVEKEEKMKRRVFILGAGVAGVASVFACTSIGTQLSDKGMQEGKLLSRSDTIEALRAPKRKRPLVAILADNQGSETTDLIVPWSVLKRSNAADVVIVSTQPGDVQLMPALKIQPDMTLDQFDALHEEGADYVLVPAFHNPKNSSAAEWLRQQSSGGATVAGICSGALVLAHAGLLADRAATTHWYDRNRLVRISPTTKLQLNNRYLADRGVATTTGVSASLPFALTLVEAISGRPRAEHVATAVGLRDFGQEHNSADFQLRAQNVLRLASNVISEHEEFGIHIDGEVDELELAFVADSWSRTYRSSVSTFASEKTGAFASSGGLQIVPDVTFSEGSKLQQVPTFNGLPADALAFTLEQISDRYGQQTASLVALQLEYDWSL
jgi:transcriptional regulator GlxA family with amidase domain